MKNLHLILVLFSIASMFTSFGVYDVDAAHVDGKGKDMGCTKGTATNNPHCGNDEPAPSSEECGDVPDDCDGDGIPDSKDACPYMNYTHTVNDKPDHDNDGIPDFKDKDTICQ